MSETKLNPSQILGGAWTQQNLISGNNTSINKVDRPYIDENTLCVYHFENSRANAVTSGTPLGDAFDATNGFAFVSGGKFGEYGAQLNKPSNRGPYCLVGNNTVSTGVGVGQYSWDCWAKLPNDASTYTQSLGLCYSYGGQKMSFDFTKDSTTNKAKINVIPTSSSVYEIEFDLNTWHHFAYDRYDGNHYFYIDGNLVATETAEFKNINTIYTSSNGTWYQRGLSYTGDNKLIVDEVRFSNVARWKGQDFTPFELPYQYNTGEPDVYAISADQYRAGTNIQISQDKVISATDTTYTAGTGINITGTTVAVNKLYVRTIDNLVAGDNVTITPQPVPVIDNYTSWVYHLNDNLLNSVTGTSATSSYARYETGKFGKCCYSSSGSSGITLGSINFNADKTIDAWFTLRSGSTYCYFGSTSMINIKNSDSTITIKSSFSGTGNDVSIPYPSGFSLVQGVFHHMAYEVDYTNSKVYLFLDGKKIYEGAKTSNIGTQSFSIVNGGSTALDEVRLSSTVRWTDDFTPWTQPYGGDPIYQINAIVLDPIKNINGYDSSKIQVLKNIQGTLTWVDEN